MISHNFSAQIQRGSSYVVFFCCSFSYRNDYFAENIEDAIRAGRRYLLRFLIDR